jgi:E3 ubiquitin-protein ligase CHFR
MLCTYIHCLTCCVDNCITLQISQRHISSVPDTVHGGNQYEKDITERCIQQSGKALQAIISEWIVKFDNKELDRSRLQLNHVDAITSRTYVCNQCYSKFIDFLLYWFRVSMPRNVCILHTVTNNYYYQSLFMMRMLYDNINQFLFFK